jgi:ABC-type Fe3+ transport system substrate-binding protein
MSGKEDAMRKAFIALGAAAFCMAAGTAAAATLADIVRDAKNEATVRVAISSEIGPKGIARLKRELKDEYGVDLDIRYTPVGSYPKRLADILAETKAGLPSSYDLTQFSDNVLSQARASGAIAPVAWREILVPGTPPTAVVEGHDALHLYDSNIGLMYNADLVRDGEVPKSLMDLRDPKWKNKLTAAFYTSNFVTYAYLLGPEKVLAALEGARANNTVFDSYAANLSRFTSGEFPIQLTSAGYYSNAKRKGINAKWVSLDVSFNTKHAAVVPKGARSPNAAKLVAVYLAGPKGNKLLQELSYVGNGQYAGHVSHDIMLSDAKAGLKMFSPIDDPKAISYLLSEEGRALEKKIGAIIFRK